MAGLLSENGAARAPVGLMGQMRLGATGSVPQPQTRRAWMMRGGRQVQISDNKFQKIDFRWQISEDRFRMTDFRWQICDLKFAI
ncbi:MAG TPA: hypothetical protein VIQ24_16355 [Pyrinomonadaceae bacterium]